MKIVIADKSHSIYADIISKTITDSASVRGTGIAKRTPEYIITKMENGNAVIALDGKTFVGFCYVEAWGHGKFVANSGLIVHPDYRGKGYAKQIKSKIFEHSRAKFPEAKIFSITTGLAVMKLNSDLGYKPVTFSELTDDTKFWAGCQTCTNFEILKSKDYKMCLCTGMLYDSNKNNKEVAHEHEYNNKTWARLKNIKQVLFLKNKKKKQ